MSVLSLIFITNILLISQFFFPQCCSSCVTAHTYFESCFWDLGPVLSLLLLETKDLFWKRGEVLAPSLSPSGALYPDIAESVLSFHFILVVITAIIVHKGGCCYFQGKRWTQSICRCFHGSVCDIIKIYETLCAILRLLEEAPCAGRFFTLLKWFKNSCKLVLVWVVNSRLEKLCIEEVSLQDCCFDPSMPCVLVIYVHGKWSFPHMLQTLDLRTSPEKSRL